MPYWTQIKTTAERWHISRITIYRYLDNIEKNKADKLS
ncbi:helix-turn-helix domain-containing protein [Enterococcus faecium]|nr:helix-turn-helix domain-containing protein [Enterococcus faecium]UDP42670.1 helix-turn-helix domain-containing protein [Enterococcus faecium UC7251]